MKKHFILIFSLLAFSACTNDNLEDMSAELNCETLNITFETHIQPILQNNCYGCHGSNLSYAGFNFENYDNVVAAANSGRLSGAVNHLPGYKPMPNGKPQLDACQIKQIDTWISSLK